MPPKRVCLNCEEPATIRFLCLDCWRMGIITGLLFGGGGEAVHQILGFFMEGLK